MSPIGAEIVIAKCEFVWERNFAVRVAAKFDDFVFGHAVIESDRAYRWWSKVVACGRHVEGDVIISDHHCTACLEEMLPLVYPNVQFDGGGQVKTIGRDPFKTEGKRWLDLIIELQCPGVVVSISDPDLGCEDS